MRPAPGTPIYSPKHPLFHILLLPTILITNNFIWGHPAGPFYTPEYRSVNSANYSSTSHSSKPDAKPKPTISPAASSISRGNEYRWAWLTPGDMKARERLQALGSMGDKESTGGL